MYLYETYNISGFKLAIHALYIGKSERERETKDEGKFCDIFIAYEYCNNIVNGYTIIDIPHI